MNKFLIFTSLFLSIQISTIQLAQADELSPDEIELFKSKVIFYISKIEEEKASGWKSTQYKDILLMKAEFDKSVAHIFAEYNEWKTYDFELLSQIDYFGNTVAHILARNKLNSWTTTDPNVLLLEDALGNTVAHALAETSKEKNWMTQNEEILKLENYFGRTVAHVLAIMNPQWQTDNKDILLLKDDSIISYHIPTVAEYLAQYNPNWMSYDIEVLSAGDSYTVAHLLAEYNPNWNPQDIDILKIRERNYGPKVIATLLEHNPNWTTQDPRILKLTVDSVKTVADVLNALIRPNKSRHFLTV